MVVVDGLYEWLDLGALQLAGFGHAAGNRGRVALNPCDKGMGERVRFAARVEGLDYHDLRWCLASVFALLRISLECRLILLRFS